uniref:DNA polymerase delta subunit 4 n=1 Tax=Leersia perrieri TaxID=77586 RepID=A0A0D9XAF2_9ORYZ
MAGGGVKGFYRQRKKGRVAKPKTSPAAKRASKKKNSSQSQDCGSDHGDEGEQQLRLFDMDMKYGPCIGITRLRRWQRAAAMGLFPPARLRPAPAKPRSLNAIFLFVSGGQQYLQHYWYYFRAARVSLGRQRYLSLPLILLMILYKD